MNPTDADDFFLTLTGFTEDQWKYRYVYLYRLYPITDRRAAGNPIWINKYPQPFNREDVLRDHGSGIYKAELLESLPTQAGKRLAVSIFQILNTDYPPKIPAGEWVDDPKNADWEWCRPKLGPHVANGATVVQQGVSPTELVNTMLRFKEATDRPEPKDSTSELITTILSSPLIAKLIPENKPPAEDKSLVMLLNMMQEDRKLMQQQLIELQKQMMTPKPPEKNWLEQALENEEMMRRIFGKGQSGPQLDGWAAVIDKAVDKIGPTVATVGGMVAQRMMMPPPTAQQPQPGRAPITIAAAPQPAASVPAPAVQPVQQQQPTPGTPEQMNLIGKYQNVIQQAFPFLVDHFRDRTKDGYDFREWFNSPDHFGNITWDQMRKDIGVEGFVQLLSTMPPEVQTQLSPPEKFRAFMTEFFSDDDPPDADDIEDDEFSRPSEPADVK